MVASISSNSMSNRADAVFSKLDTKNQGYIEKTDLQDALAKAGGKGQAANIDDSFSALDGDGDGKVTKSELTEAMTRLSDQLNAQFDASRAAGPGGPAGAGGPPAPHGAGGAGGGGGDGDSATGSTSTSTDYVAAADTDGDGTVSDAEQAAYDKKVASGEADSGGNKATDGPEKAAHQKDPLRELAHTLQLLKAYAENSGSDDAAASSAGTGTVSVEA